MTKSARVLRIKPLLKILEMEQRGMRIIYFFNSIYRLGLMCLCGLNNFLSLKKKLNFLFKTVDEEEMKKLLKFSANKLKFCLFPLIWGRG